MEGLTLEDARVMTKPLGGSILRDSPYRYREPRMLTPDASKGSDEGLRDEGPPKSRTYTEDAKENSNSFSNSGESAQVWRDGNYIYAPQSPPYRSVDPQKPSLPPLKTVLGDTMSSPPKTPSPRESASQPFPQEPSYISSTYKPPALYPHKKQKTEPFPQLSTSKVPPMLDTLEQHADESTVRRNIGFSPLNFSSDHALARRASLYTATTHEEPSSPGAQYTVSSRSREPQSNRSSFDVASSYYQTPIQTPSTSTYDSTFPRFASSGQDSFQRDTHDTSIPHYSHSLSRRSSTSGYAQYGSHYFDRDAPSSAPYPTRSRHALSFNDRRVGSYDPVRYGRQDGQVPRAVAGIDTSPPTFLMPSPYELQHGKSRKRSNLPKQSTEIMKTWFDENMQNPYPSEEQKQIFSNATGISMTQVSNWFINHRRRCPELRDRREKTRGDLRIVEVSGRDRKYSI